MRRLEWSTSAPGAELGGGLGRQVVLAEAERRHERDVLRAADELLQLGIEGLVEVLVLGAEGDAAMPDDRLAGDLAERLCRFPAVVICRPCGDPTRRPPPR